MIIYLWLQKVPMTKPQKDRDNKNQTKKNTDNFDKDKKNIFNSVEDRIKDALVNFNQKDKKEIEEMVWKWEFIDQLRKYFEKENPVLLDELESKDKLKVYVEQFKSQWFTVENLTKDAKILDEYFAESESEYDVTQKSLKKLEKYCEDEKDILPSGIFNDFAAFAKLETTPIWVNTKSKIKKAADINKVRNRFLEDRDIKLKETQKNELNKITSPKYAPTNRLLVSAAIKKIRKNLPKELLKDFNDKFPQEITITSEIQNLNDLKNQRNLFLQDNARNIDKDLAKKLDKIKVLNQDIYEEFENEGIALNKWKWFSEQEQEFRIVFNKLATRQLFDGINKSNTIVDMQIENIGDVFNGFPPYVNELFKDYSYNPDKIKNVDATFEADINKLDKQIADLEIDAQKLSSDEEKDVIFTKIKAIREEKNTRKRIWYSKLIESENPKLWKVVGKLISNKFNLSALEKSEQQILTDELVKSKLQSVIKEWTAEVLGIDEDRFMNNIKNIFDLSKKEVTIPGPNWDITFDCLEKSFLWWPLKESMEIGLKGPILSDKDKKNLPLNIRLWLTEDNKDFFEKSPIFEDLFQQFEAKNGPQTLHDGYKVTKKDKNGKPVTWYLSNYPPRWEEAEAAEKKYKQKTNSDPIRYLYSQPITRPDDDRELMFRDEENAVMIWKSETKNYDVHVNSREINLNGKGIGALLFGTTAGQYAQENKLNNNQMEKLEQSFDKLDKKELYIDTLGQKEIKPELEEKTIVDDNKETKEKSDYEKCIETWKNLWGYQTIDEWEKKWEKIVKKYGFVEGAKIILPCVDSDVPPPASPWAKMMMTMEITEINEDKKTFTVKTYWGETSLWQYEGKEKKLPLSPDGIAKIQKAFGEKLYKLPKWIEDSPNNIINILDNAKVYGIEPSKSFKNLERNGSSWVQKVWDKTEDVLYFGKTEFSPWELMDATPVIETLCKVEYHKWRKKPYTVFINHKFWDKPEDKKSAKIELDQVNFALFITSRQLTPKTKSEAEDGKTFKATGPNQAQPPKKLQISIAGITGMFKNVTKKISEWMKKYEEKQTETLTDAVMFEWKLMSKLAGIMPSDKLKAAFGGVWIEYLSQRDNKIRKKIEDRKNIFTWDPDFWSEKLRNAYIKPYLDGVKPFKDQRQAAGMLLATIEKGKGPYSRNADRPGKWNWIKILMWEGHQARYLKMKEKLEQELKEWISLNGQQWANDKQNEILKLEMKYITHVIDGRQLRNDDTPELEARFSKKFAGEVEKTSNEFFKSEQENWYGKTADISFELARFEYFRLLWDRPQQAIGNLRAVAEKAVTDEQRKVFESMVLTGMLSWVFNSITQEDKKVIEKVCRTTWFLPGLLMRQPNVHHKIAKLLKVATGKDITYGEKGKEKTYNPSNFDFWKITDGNQTKNFVNYEKWFNWRYKSNEKTIKEFLSFEWTNADGKKLTDLYEDPKTPNDVKQLLWEIIGKRYETNEPLDSKVQENWKSLQQNLLCRNQSLIEEIIKFQDGSFKWKDKDAIEDAKTTRTKITDAMNEQNKEIGKKSEKKTDIIFTLKMFANRFEDKWFNSEAKKDLIRILKTVREEKNKGNAANVESAKQILRYEIVGKIIRNSGNGQVPDELKTWLETFKNFFENNIDDILTEDVIYKWFGPAYVESLSKPAFDVAPWDEYVKVTVFNKWWYRSDLSQEERAEITKKGSLYRLDNYLNAKIYKIANELDERDYGIPNTLKAMYDYNKDRKKTTKQQLSDVLWKDAIAIKNHTKLKKSEQKPETDDGLTEEERAAYQSGEYDENDYFGMTW